ncbi:MlaE family ABC transporter permease [Magnetospirillum fulvum]|uniref:MlaE family ABC transporter permease n=1 Tax=Magnetospirillum fulvum TaxID=1082 RepID=UPI001FCE0AE1|nr:ABC transporter permease [Magnetospirillum fulvum]
MTAQITPGEQTRPETPSSEGLGWSAALEGTNAVVTLSGDWIACARGVEGDVAAKILKSGAQAIVFQSDRLGQWDSALIATLSAVRDAARDRGVEFDQSGLPAPARKLLGLIEDSKPIPPPSPQPPLLERVGLWGLRVFDEATEAVALIGSTCLRGAAAIRGRSTMRGVDLLDCMKDAGAAALPIVTVINFLVGGILAFVGAVQLRRFGADIYVASMVGIAVVREMAALMTAIIMAGRTGGAYAASLATMQGNEEIDSLRTVGIPVFDYLVLPRVLALTAMMPILYLYGCAVGIFGGFVVSVLTLNLSPIVYVETTRIAVSGNQFMLGFAKSIAFGTLIAIAGCRVGLRAGRSSADIGRAATSAVVVSIIGIIVLDAVFALCANALGI